MMDTLSEPAIISAIVAGIIALAMKVLDLRMSKAKDLWGAKSSDRELLSQDEREFRITVIAELKAAKEELKEKDERIERLIKENLDVKTELMRLK